MNRSGFGFKSTAEEVTDGLDLTGKTYLVTGCNSGLGLETIRVLGLRGGHVIGAARTKDKAAAAIESAGVVGTPVECELSEASSGRACVTTGKELGRPIDALICNAGIMALPEPRTTHGLDLQFLTNHIGHFILVTQVLDALAENGRVVMLSSGAHRMAPEAGIEFDNLSGERDYAPWKMYGQSKLANLLFAKQLAKRLETGERTANAVHPGVIRTNLARHIEDSEAMLARMKLKAVPQGAATQCLVATRPELSSVSGEYFADCKVAKTHPKADDVRLAERLWDRSEEIAARLTSSSAR
jgi:NAD(P)-dependent dehydrogenase (short-subunit alcohol dehydrogenase family)